MGKINFLLVFLKNVIFLLSRCLPIEGAFIFLLKNVPSSAFQSWLYLRRIFPILALLGRFRWLPIEGINIFWELWPFRGVFVAYYLRGYFLLVCISWIKILTKLTGGKINFCVSVILLIFNFSFSNTYSFTQNQT